MLEGRYLRAADEGGASEHLLPAFRHLLRDLLMSSG
jgi:hypothetical protein